MASGNDDELGPAVFDSAASGDVQRLRSLLRFKRATRVKDSLSWRDPFNRTPLLAAAAAGHTDMVRVLVEEYGTNIEESKFNNYANEELTPLVYAANVGHHKTVEVLLKNRARVDHAFPLHRACFASSAGNLKCVKLLMAHGADVNRKYVGSLEDGEMMDGSTPLAVASEHMCTNIVEYLLQNRADPNIPDKQGNRPMHSAFNAMWHQHSEQRCRGGCVKDGERIIKILVQQGARQIQNEMELTPVMIGALTGNLLVVLDSTGIMSNLSHEETKEALELMASHFFLTERHQIGLETLAKALASPCKKPNGLHAPEGESPYGDFCEPVTLKDLDRIRSNETNLQVISLMIRERILSKEAQKYYLWQAIRDFVDRCRPTPEGKSLALLALRHETNLEMESGFFCGFAVESMIRLLDPTQVNLADSNLEEIVVLLKLAAINLSPDVSEMTLEKRREAVQYHRFKSTNILLLLGVYANYPQLSSEDKELLFTLVQQFVFAYQMTIDVVHKLHAASAQGGMEDVAAVRSTNQNTGMSIFHLYYPVVARRRPTEEENIKERMVIMLLKSGADPCLVDIDGYNALHFLVKRCPASKQTETFRNNIVVPLTEWGCPILKRNSETGRSVIEDCTNPDTKQLLIDLSLPPLLNLCCRVIRKNKIPYQSSVPVTLAATLDMNV
ncbi:protein fem-1 homolog B-like [Lytechinus pictus]|uniref:protein fem-1 homolog B-like n=1 Tax=Lytechinus pictus TaxID=7653 RepID=UPI00240DC325|nr:protein fem-1 homolog B-like [Lytechinus pictus]